MKKINYLRIGLLIMMMVFFKPSSMFGFIKTNGKVFDNDGKPYFYIGTNFWYGPIIASTGVGGNRVRLIKELDLMQQLGINNLRILVGAEGPDNEPTRVTPTLQLSPGVYNDTLLEGLDFLLAEMQKRGQFAIIYLHNSWDWSGGYAQYLNWNGYGKIPYPSVKPNTWPDFMNYIKQFHTCAQCKEEYKAHIKFILGRTNQFTGKKYTDDPAIMAWEIANEPRAFSNENIPAFTAWLAETSAYIKSLDKNHMVTTGSEGQKGCEDSYALFETIHADPNIDYCTMHIWPKNWGWINPADIPASTEKAIHNTNDYIDTHVAIALKLNKPIVAEEFGLPRDLHGYSPREKTTCRDSYYENIFRHLFESAKTKNALAGCNFWAWGGLEQATPGHIFWSAGDAYLGDPPQEEQGLNSVFHHDSTLLLIKHYNDLLLIP